MKYLLKFLKWFLGLFSPYVHPFERKVDKFFRSIKSTSSSFEVKKELLALMQENLIVTNVWMEKKYKGYNYLDKATRKQMYQDVQAIIAEFNKFREEHKLAQQDLRAQLDQLGYDVIPAYAKKLYYLAEIMAFLRPGKYYHYIKTASFGKLLRDPKKAKLEGDCNQIVTLYIYLFSLEFDLNDLEIKLLPEHVCLHFKGLDIEATNGTFQKYREESQVLPVTEIISTNLLDLADFRESVQEISPRTMIKSSQLAYSISSLKDLVRKNLNIAYINLAIAAIRAHDYKTAIFYYGKSDDREGLKNAYHHAAVYYMKTNNFSKASYYAGQSGDRELDRAVKHNEAVYYYKADKLDKALSLFQALGDTDMVKACYGKMYNDLARKVSAVRTLADAKRYKSTYQKMSDLAVKMGDSDLAASLRKTLDQI